jgi:hypothetical protein
MDGFIIFMFCFIGAFVALIGGSIVASQADARSLKESKTQFAKACPAVRRRELERLIANCIDTPNSTVFEALALIERDAQLIETPKLRERFLAQFKGDSIAARTTAVRSFLEEQYLPNALNE